MVKEKYVAWIMKWEYSPLPQYKKWFMGLLFDWFRFSGNSKFKPVEFYANLYKRRMDEGYLMAFWQS